jgi:hypothetical protein
MLSRIQGITRGTPGFQAIIVFTLNSPENQGGIKLSVTECDF